MNGKGIIYNKIEDNEIYEGEIKEDKIEGKGIHYYSLII